MLDKLARLCYYYSMIKNEIENKIKQITEAEPWVTIGIRLEDCDREVGSTIDNSKHNPDREDNREFPIYGSDEYNDLPDLDGVSAWNVTDRFVAEMNIDQLKIHYDHCYIITGDEYGNHDDPDVDEILIRDAIVAAKIW